MKIESYSLYNFLRDKVPQKDTALQTACASVGVVMSLQNCEVRPNLQQILLYILDRNALECNRMFTPHSQCSVGLHVC